jgi:putative PEP-CTERM system histidine kinase
MEINELAAIGHAIAAALFASLAALMLSHWRDRPKAGVIALACVATAIWSGVQTVGSLGYLNVPIVLLIAEWVRNIAWIVALASILRDMGESGRSPVLARRYRAVFVAASALLIIYYISRTADSPGVIAIVAGGVLFSTIALALSEQIFRNAQFEAQSGLKYLCVGVGGIYVYDLVILTLTIVYREMNVDQWAARGFVTALFGVPVGLAAQRSFRLSLDAHIPRQIVFYSFAFIAAGIFIVFMVMGDYYISTYAGTWGGVVRIVLLASAVGTVAVLAVSPTIRARVRVFLMKSFFQYKYDYRKEWLRFIGTLSQSELDNMANTAVRAVAQIVNSPGGIVWVREQDGEDYLPVGTWGIELPVMTTVGGNSQLIRFLKKRQWVVDLNEMRTFPARYEGLELDPWMSEQDDWWLVVPLFLSERLFGFIVLQEPNVVRTLNFEDHDLLRTVGRHVATHINQAESDRRLAESRQFGTYNRLTAFLMHDLNNLIAQQSLVVKNAEKHRNNPDFVDDAIETIANSVARMRRLMEQLSSGSKLPEVRKVVLVDILERAAGRCEQFRPQPTIRANADFPIFVRADVEKLTTVAEHLIRNAQDATDEYGSITIEADATDSIATFRIQDTGCGMSPEFIRERLFRPFDSTKGSQSMGIGAYQAREYIRQLGGQIEVTSKPGQGTSFDISLPIT